METQENKRKLLRTRGRPERESRKRNMRREIESKKSIKTRKKETGNEMELIRESS